MATADVPEKVSPPYIPWGTFANFVERLRATAIPSKIGNTVMPNLAGGVRSQVRSALRFLGLTDAEDHVTPAFRELVQAHGTDTWGQVLSGVISSAYEPIISGLDLQGATPGQLSGKFRAAGMTGQMAEKAIRFLLAALESAGQPFSPHLSARGGMASAKGGRRGGRQRTPVGRDRGAEEPESPDALGQAPAPGAKVRTFGFPIPGRPDIRVVVPEDLDDLDSWAMVDQTLRAYIGLNAKAKGRITDTERG